MGRIDRTLADLGVVLPEAAPPAANYVPFVISRKKVYVAGQISKNEQGFVTGKLGGALDVAAGQAAARLCGLQLIAQVKAACQGDLDRVKRVIKLGGFVNATPDFVDIPQVMNGCSDLMVAVFGDAGRHARSAVACPTLPFGVAVEVDAIFEIG